ncbi:MAG: type 4a pilus biogenesis protein PilO [Granulosicoccus sp.]|nr:type 4a pilus biogenesis protein PilO [Granulosicoccus sp.]
MLLVTLACAAVLFAMFWFLIKPETEKLTVVEAQEQELRIKFDAEQAKAANRSAYVEQLAEMQKTFNVMLRQLPNKTDIESLLVDLSQTSVASGLEVKYLKPESEVPREFYAEYPINISVTGQYHQFGQFISGLAALPRIVTLQNISIAELKQPAAARENSNNSVGRLKMDLTATTYRYIDEDEEG